MGYIPPNPNGQATKANSAPVVLASDQNNALETGGNLASIAANTPAALNTNPPSDAWASPVRLTPNLGWRTTFASATTNAVDTAYWNLVRTGSGQTVNQTGGNLVLTTGTTANSETVIRSVLGWDDSFLLRYQMLASQRIANQNLYIEMVDVIGDGLSYTINSATSVTITITNCPFTAANVGQSMYIGAITGAAGIPGRYAIASVSGNNVTFTVASWPASGSGTCSLFGWNYHQIVYNGTTATNATYDAQRRGYNSGATTATINTSASPGHIGQVYADDGIALYSDGLAASNTAFQMTQRASRLMNMPASDTQLYLQIRSLNGTSAPASTTTWTLGFIAVEEFVDTPVTIRAAKQIGGGAAPSVQVQNTPAVTISSGTVTTVSTVTSVTQSAVALPVQSNPIASGAITTTANAALSPTNGTGVVFQLNCTAVSGTTPTMDVAIQESYDNGSTYITVYQFPRVTATLSTPLFSPPLKLSGSKLQAAQTIGGTSPSFTRALFMDQLQRPVEANIRQIFDRTVTLTTLSSTTANLTLMGIAQNLQLAINIGAATTAPALQLQVSEDGGASWVSIGSPLTAVASSTVQTTVSGINASLVRAIVTTAGASVTAGYVLIKAY